MELLHAAKIRLYPNRDQESLLAKTFGCKRFVWNLMLAERQAFYREHGTGIGKLRKTEKDWKKTYPFLKDVDSIALQQARLDLNVAYKNFLPGAPGFPISRAGRAASRTARST